MTAKKCAKVLDGLLLVLLHILKPEKMDIGVIFVVPGTLDMWPVGTIADQAFFAKLGKLIKCALDHNISNYIN